MSQQSSDPTVDTPAAPAAKKPFYKRWWFIVIAVLVAIGVISSVAGGGDKSTTASGESTTAAAASAPASEAAAEPTKAAEEATKAAEEAAAGIGTPVRDGKFEFTVESVETGVTQVGNEYLNQQAQGSFTLVTLKVTNIGDKPQTFTDSNVKGLDSQGRELSSDSGAGIYANTNGQGFLNEINPGNSSTAVVVFDVAPGGTLSSIEVADSAFSNGATIKLS